MEYEKYITKLVKLAGVSREYADAVWHTLDDDSKNSPLLSASVTALEIVQKRRIPV